MIRKITLVVFILFYCVNPAYAGITNILRMIENYSSMMLKVQRDMLAGQNSIVHMQSEILKSQQDINSLMHQVNDHLSGHSGWGTYQFQDHQSYGANASDWASVINMVETGNANSDFGQMIASVNSQFPQQKHSFNNAISSPEQQKYYALKSQTVIATRAASQLDYNKIQAQISYQQMLQQNIEKTSDIKAAIDLSNRIHVEGNLINLEILRQIALSNQHQSVTEQAAVNAAISNARFLTK